jgi:predicted nucleic acid-binding protein
MRFWDSSAIVPLVTRESSSERCRLWLRRDPMMLVWSLAATEVISALTRKHREGALEQRTLRIAKRRLRDLETAWSEVVDWDAVRTRARRLLETHPLRAADALHLAAALVAFEERAADVAFVTFDARLADAADREGFTVLREESAPGDR